ncbi:hypothetical protein NEMIN01_1155 [Nematocida minor]|uniref:uncharacterized protein n=1 Tax=Nematocida minor TaxID=1912983 RepID=UPI00222105EB|nr:uncharacterized protein NEMIN01_1155 [Nematocida minor]KAI5190690.1 hypothetical protein NEMIN01_1155 [Nematocida minor]
MENGRTQTTFIEQSSTQSIPTETPGKMVISENSADIVSSLFSTPVVFLIIAGVSILVLLASAYFLIRKASSAIQSRFRSETSTDATRAATDKSVKIIRL